MSCVYLVQLKLVTTETPKTKLCELVVGDSCSMDHSKDQPLCLVFGLQGLQNILVTPFKEVCVVTEFKVYNMFCVQDAAGDVCFEVQSILVLLMVQKSQTTTVWMFLKPCKQWDKLPTVFFSCQVCMPKR